jgi:hypothetical protein
MSSIAKSLVAVSILVIPAGTASVKAAPRGFMEGHLKIVFLSPVEPSDDMPRPEIAPESYAAYPLIILSAEARREVARLTADEHGNYRAALPPGDYVLDVPDQVAKHIRATPHPFTVISNQTVRIDITILAGFYKGQSLRSLGWGRPAFTQIGRIGDI